MYIASMRTTITFPDDLHAQLVSVSRDRRETVSRTVTELLRRALAGDRSPHRMVRNRRTGFVGIDVGRPITAEDVRLLEDEE